MSESDEPTAPESPSARQLNGEQAAAESLLGPANGILDAEILYQDPAAPRRGCEKMGLAPGPCLEDAEKNGLSRVPVPVFSRPLPRQPLRYGLRALLALMAICCGQFAFMFYVAPRVLRNVE